MKVESTKKKKKTKRIEKESCGCQVAKTDEFVVQIPNAYLHPSPFSQILGLFTQLHAWYFVWHVSKHIKL